ncbi:MAG TPA: hypothetical protein VLL07_02475, partial [Pontiella sp.]|nr:hypothetical protein [Pontiella sp.]
KGAFFVQFFQRGAQTHSRMALRLASSRKTSAGMDLPVPRITLSSRWSEKRCCLLGVAKTVRDSISMM